MLGLNRNTPFFCHLFCFVVFQRNFTTACAVLSSDTAVFCISCLYLSHIFDVTCHSLIVLLWIVWLHLPFSICSVVFIMVLLFFCVSVFAIIGFFHCASSFSYTFSVFCFFFSCFLIFIISLRFVSPWIHNLCLQPWNSTATSCRVSAGNGMVPCLHPPARWGQLIIYRL